MTVSRANNVAVKGTDLKQVAREAKEVYRCKRL
jgi:hypothetical protein